MIRIIACCESTTDSGVASASGALIISVAAQPVMREINQKFSNDFSCSQMVKKKPPAIQATRGK
jgi:hypothetical protein